MCMEKGYQMQRCKLQTTPWVVSLSQQSYYHELQYMRSVKHTFVTHKN